jgi:hypothetical protein
MINAMSIPMPCAEPRLRPIQGTTPLAAAFVVLAAVGAQVQGTGLSTHFGSKYDGQGSRAWSPPD